MDTHGSGSWASQRLFGKEATCKSVVQKPSGQLFVNVKLGVVPFQRPLAEVQLADSLLKRQNGKTLRQVRKIEEFWAWALDLGFGPAFTPDAEIDRFCDDLAGTKPVKACGGHIGLYWKFLQWSLEAPSSIVYMPVELLAAFFQTSEDQEGYDVEEALDRQKFAIRSFVKRPWQLLLVPIFGSTAHCEHFTLPVAERIPNNEALPKRLQYIFRYYDTLQECKPDCFQRAEYFVKHFLGIEKNDDTFTYKGL